MRSPSSIPARWLTTAEAATYTRYDSLEGFVAWAASCHVIPIRRGRRLLWDRLDIDRTLEIEKLRGHAPRLMRSVA